MKGKTICKISLIFLSWFTLSTPLFGEEYTFTLHKEFLTGANPSLKVQNTSGLIKIESHPENKIIIDAFKVVEADNSKEAEKLADQIEVIIEKYKEEVEIKTKYTPLKSRSFWEKVFGFDWKSSGYVDYRIVVPEEIKLDVSSTSGEVKISNISGEVEATSTSGDLWMKRIRGDLNLETTSGDVEISMIGGGVMVYKTSSDLEMFDIKGDVDISSTSGNTSTEGVVGLIQIDNTSGDLFLKGIEGNIEATTASGDMIIDQIEGGLHLESSSGDIEVKTKIFPQYEYYVETTSGYIDFSLPENSDAQIKLKTSSGSIKTKLPLRLHTISRNLLKGELGAGGAAVYLVTSSGDIELREYRK